MADRPAGAPTGATSSGVLIVNLGTPDAPTHWAVRRYLREFLWDPRVVQIPRLPWCLILHVFILPFRPFATARKYASIWREDGSPLRVYLGRQVQLLRGFLGERAQKPIPVPGPMRYVNP
jgi:ferrochelatase